MQVEASSKAWQSGLSSVDAPSSRMPVICLHFVTPILSSPAQMDQTAAACTQRDHSSNFDSCDIDLGTTSSRIKTVKGTMKVHSVQVSSNGSLMLRDPACFCAQCLDGSPARCPSKEFVGDWRHVWMDVTASATAQATRQ